VSLPCSIRHEEALTLENIKGFLTLEGKTEKLDKVREKKNHATNTQTALKRSLRKRKEEPNNGCREGPTTHEVKPASKL